VVIVSGSIARVKVTESDVASTATAPSVGDVSSTAGTSSVENPVSMSNARSSR
jgi:hypothetical protein